LRLGRGGQAQKRGKQRDFDGLFICPGHWVLGAQVRTQPPQWQLAQNTSLRQQFKV
jgi:hypothetical protein